MKKIVTYLLSAGCLVGAAACSSDPTFRIDGTWEGGDGQTVYLRKDHGNKNIETLDSVVVNEGRFAFSGPLVYDRRLVAAGKSDQEIMLEASPILVTVRTETRGEGERAREVTLIDVAPSAEQSVLQQGAGIATGLAMIDFGSLIAYSEVVSDPVKFDSVRTGVEMMKAEVWSQLHTMLDTSRNVHASAFVIGRAVAKNQPLDSTILYYEKLTPEVRSSYAGQWLAEQIENMKSVNVGGIAPDIDLASPDGTQISLASLRGKYVLIDFWASWCKPCLAEAPNVKAVYDKYRDREFEVYGVSLDEKSDAWQAAIAEYGLDWIHVSSLQGWKCPAAKRYDVTGIPKTFLLDPDGRIIAVDLRGEKLGETIASLLGE